MTAYLPLSSLSGRLYYSDNPPIANTGPFVARGQRINETGIIRLPLPAEQVIDLCEAKHRLPNRGRRSKSLKRLVSKQSLRDFRPATAGDVARSSSSSSSSSSTENIPAMATDRTREHARTDESILRARPHLNEDARTASGNSVASGNVPATQSNLSSAEKPVASSNGLSLSIALAEPILFLQGFEQHDESLTKTTMLRGSLVLRVSKPSKLKTISLRFRGRATTDWPEGIPPRKTEYKDVEHLMNHTWTFFNFQSPNGDSHCADTMQPLKGPRTTTTEVTPGITSLSLEDNLTRTGQDPSLSIRDQRKLSLQQHGRSRSVGKAETISVASTKGYRIFTPGEYVYNFELPIDSRTPETIRVELGSVKYELEALVERAGAFRANLMGSKEVTLIRAPAENSLETVEPIAISRDWEDQLHYDIVISGKSFPLGSQVPIAFKLTPLAKVQCHRIKVYVTENIQYFTANKRVHRLEPTRKIQLFEKRADGPSSSAFPGSTVRVLSGGGVAYDHRAAAAAGDEHVDRDLSNLLGNLEGEHNVGPTEMEFNVQLPSCHQMMDKEKAGRIHFDTTYSNIQVNHWIKIVLRLSKPDATDPAKRRHFEISIDSPFNILSCQATQANTSLPAYSSPDAAMTLIEPTECGCPGALRMQRPATTSSLAQGVTTSANASPEGSSTDLSRHPTNDQVPNTITRPMHLLRTPSFLPPAWSDDDPPPPLITPPPQYESRVDGDPLEDYFSRLAEALDNNELPMSPGRVEVPLTPGGRTNRSMDEQRTWLPVGAPPLALPPLRA